MTLVSSTFFIPCVGMPVRFKRDFYPYQKGDIDIITYVGRPSRIRFYICGVAFKLANTPHDIWVLTIRDVEVAELPKQKIDEKYESLYT